MDWKKLGLKPVPKAEVEKMLRRVGKLQNLDPLKKLEKLRKEQLGTFDTGIKCNCRKSTIKAIVTEYVKPLGDVRHIPLGPVKTPQQLLEEFETVQRFKCIHCGALFDGAIVTKRMEDAGTKLVRVSERRQKKK